MFNSKPKPSANTAAVETIIGAHTQITGDISFSGGLAVDGRVVGSITAADPQNGTFILSEKGHVEGEVRAPQVYVNGELEGDIVAAQKVELAANARVHGNIYYRTLEMAVGAQVNGRIVHEDDPPKQLPKPEEADA